MKKIITLMITLIMVLTLGACGGVDTSEAKAAYTKAQQSFNEVVETINANIDAYTEEEIKVMTDMADVLNKHAELLNSDADIEQEQVDEMIAWYKDVEKWVSQVKEEVKQKENTSSETAPVENNVETITVPVEIVNQTGVDLVGLAMTPANTEDWGENLLTEVLLAETSGVAQMTFTADTLVWDLLVEDGEGNQLTFMGIDFTEQSTEGATLVLAVTEAGEYMAAFTEQ